MADTLQHLLRERAEQDGVAVTYGGPVVDRGANTWVRPRRRRPR